MQAKSIFFSNPVYYAIMKSGKPNRSDKVDFGERLCRLREAARLSQREVAKEMGISQPSYVNWESHNVALKPEQLTKLAKVLGVNVAELLEDSPSLQRRGGPQGKARRILESLSRLPRGQQEQIIEIVEAIIEKKVATA